MLFTLPRMARSTGRPSPSRASALLASWRLSRIGIGVRIEPSIPLRFEGVVFVLHMFQKKSKRGVATPKADIDLIRERLKVAEQVAKELTP
jgi:hypothetical protein